LKLLYTIGLLLLSNLFMTLAWYGHLKFKDYDWSKNIGLFSVILLSWGMAFFEYCLQVPANRIGSDQYGGPLTLIQLKVIQEVISLVTFSIIVMFMFKHETFRWNHIAAFACLILAVYFVFRDTK
jgi:uncharacterized protein (DUF486 family)